MTQAFDDNPQPQGKSDPSLDVTQDSAVQRDGGAAAADGSGAPTVRTPQRKPLAPAAPEQSSLHADRETVSDPAVTFTSHGGGASAAAPKVGVAKVGAAPRFAPGAVVAQRYRIIEQLGVGGMGEVYRAHDQTLDVTVALKFVSQAQANDPALMNRFFDEARIAREVTHPNVCRVYDIGQASGQPFITMEFVDGEHLGALLGRIGSFTRDKGLDIAYQLCAGLDAAHEKGVLHRDLKPANIMIDGKGHVRITDFGLAVRSDDADQSVGGTPAYMAPEQWTGDASKPQTDIYALGLILYEIFFGCRAFDGKTMEVLRDQHSRIDPPFPQEPSQTVDPEIQRVIRWCLKKDPGDRPASVDDVLRALPGGDPIQAALAADQTPSPQAIAEAGRLDDRLSRLAPIAIAVLAALLGFIVMLSGMTFPTSIHSSKPPAILAYEADNLTRELGVIQQPADTADGYFFPFHMHRHSRHTMPPPAGQTPPSEGLTYWRRTSLTPMVARDALQAVTYFDPPMTEPGMVRIATDIDGVLLRFDAVPTAGCLVRAANARKVAAAGADPATTGVDAAADGDAAAEAGAEAAADHGKPPSPPWSMLFSKAGLRFEKFKPVAADDKPAPFADKHYAWESEPSPSWAQNPGATVLVQATTFQDVLTSFVVICDMPPPSESGLTNREAPEEAGSHIVHVESRSTAGSAANVVGAIAFMIVFGFATTFGVWHVVKNRGDRRGALRLALVVLLLNVLLFPLTSRLAGPDVLASRLIAAMAYSLFDACFMALIYLAVEPYARRHWPATLISWQRLLEGRWWDALVGRDVLLGMTAGAAIVTLFQVDTIIPFLRGLPPHPMLPPTQALAIPGAQNFASAMGLNLLIALKAIFATLTILTLLTMLAKRRPWAIALTWVMWTTLFSLFGSTFLASVLLGGLMAAIMVGTLVGVGFLGALAAMFAMTMLLSSPITSNPEAWHAPLGFTGLGLIFALALFGLIALLAGKRPTQTAAPPATAATAATAA